MAPLALQDLVKAKKAQLDKDWRMIRRLVEQSYFARPANPAPDQVEFWLREMRTPELLIAVGSSDPEAARRFGEVRPAVAVAVRKDLREVARSMEKEEREERCLDREYWDPLMGELLQLCSIRRRVWRVQSG